MLSDLLENIENRSAVIRIVGQDCVGLPFALRCEKVGSKTIVARDSIVEAFTGGASLKKHDFRSAVAPRGRAIKNCPSSRPISS